MLIGKTNLDPDAPEGVNPTPPEAPIIPGNTVEITEADKNGFYYRLQWTFIERYESSVSHDDAKSTFTLPDWGGDSEVPNLPNAFAYIDWVDGYEYANDGSILYVSYYVNSIGASYLVNTPEGFKPARATGGVWCPINYSILKQLKFRNQEQVLQDGLCAILFVLIEQELQWYQSAFWEGIIVITTIAVVSYIIL